MNSVRTA
jgi:hypothetical protein